MSPENLSTRVSSSKNIIAMANNLTLTGIPVEILLDISDSLPPADRACLALCCHVLMNIITQAGARPLKDLLAGHEDGDTESERCLFLSRLSSDHAQFVVCYPCTKLHLWKDVPHPMDRLSGGPCKIIANLDGFHPIKIPSPYILIADWYLSDAHYYLDPLHVQLAISRSLHGPQYGFPAAFLSYTEVKPDYEEVDESSLPRRPVFLTRHTAHVTSIDARVCPDSATLLLRVQSLRIGLEKYVKDKDERDAAATWGDYIHLNQCTHLNCLPHPQMEWEWQNAGPPRSPNYKQFPESAGAKFDAACGNCKTFYRFDIRKFGDGYLVFVITRYISLRSVQAQKKERDVTEVSEDVTYDMDVQTLESRFNSCPGDGRSKEILFGEDLFLRNVRLVTEKKYEEMEQLGPKSEIWFQRLELS